MMPEQSLTPGAIYFVQASDSALLDRYLKQFKESARNAGFANPWKRLSAKGIDWASLKMEWQSLSFFGGDVFIISDTQAWKKADWELLASCLEGGQSSHLLVVCAESFDQRLKAIKQLMSLATFVLLASPVRKAWVPWAIDLAKQDFGLTLSHEAAFYLKECLGEEPWQAISALRHLALYVHPQTHITSERIRTCFGGSGPADIFAFTREVAAGNKKAAFAMLGKLMEERTDSLYILSMLRRHYRILLTLSALDKRAPSETRAKRAGVHPYFLKEYEAELIRLTPQALIDIYHQLARMDAKLKSSAISPQLLYLDWMMRNRRRKTK